MLTVDGQAAPQPLTPPLTFRAGAGAPWRSSCRTAGRSRSTSSTASSARSTSSGSSSTSTASSRRRCRRTGRAEALKAQAVAARSYAMATRQVGAPVRRLQRHAQPGVSRRLATRIRRRPPRSTRRRGRCSSTTARSRRRSSRRRRAASPSRRRTGSARPVPYLVSVPDPFDTISPYHNWGPVPGHRQDGRLGAEAAGPDHRRQDDAQRRRPRRDDRPRSRRRTNLSVAARSCEARSGLRSTWFDVGILSLAPPVAERARRLRLAVSLSGFVRGSTGVSFEERPSATPWQTVGPVVPAADGSVKLTAKPTITTDYRLATSAAPQARCT